MFNIVENKTTILIKSQGVRRKLFLGHCLTLILSCGKLTKLLDRSGSSVVRRKLHHSPRIIIWYGLSNPNLVRVRKRAIVFNSITNQTKVEKST